MFSFFDFNVKIEKNIEYIFRTVIISYFCNSKIVNVYTYNRSVGRTLFSDDPQRHNKAPSNNEKTSEVHATIAAHMIDKNVIIFYHFSINRGSKNLIIF